MDLLRKGQFVIYQPLKGHTLNNKKRIKKALSIIVIIISIIGLIIFIEYCLFDSNLQQYHLMTDTSFIENKYHSILNVNESEKEIYISKYPSFRRENDGWILYRLGDMFRSTTGWGKQHASDGGYDYHKENFPNSIATEYMETVHLAKDNDFPTLIDIIKKRSNKINFMEEYHVTFEDTLVVHLRTGDVIDDRNLTQLSVKDILLDKTNKYYRPLIYYIKILENSIKKYHGQLKKVLIITGYHLGTNHDKSTLYIISIMKLFKLFGFTDISLRINENPDTDLLIMSNSKYFIKSGGGFSKMVANVVDRMGGNVYPCISMTTFCFRKHGQNCFYCKD